MKILFALILLLILSATSITTAQDIEDTLMIYGRNRFFKTHLPLGYNYQKQYPVVFAFHGGLGNPGSFNKQTGLSKKADEEGFIVVYPYGTGAFDKKLLTWNTWNCCGYANKKDINDIDFIKALLKKVKEKYNVDEKRFYATGMSNGGMMCYLLACEMPDKFAAVAPVVAAMLDTSACTPSEQVSFIIFNSVDDEHIPYNGGIGEKSLVDIEKLPVETSIDFWVKNYDCFLLNQSESKYFVKTSYKNNNGTEIVFYKMLSGGHSWPGGKKIRRFTDNPVKSVSATDLIWEFFKYLHK